MLAFVLRGGAAGIFFAKQDRFSARQLSYAFVQRFPKIVAVS